MHRFIVIAVIAVAACLGFAGVAQPRRTRRPGRSARVRAARARRRSTDDASARDVRQALRRPQRRPFPASGPSPRPRRWTRTPRACSPGHGDALRLRVHAPRARDQPLAWLGSAGITRPVAHAELARGGDHGRKRFRIRDVRLPRVPADQRRPDGDAVGAAGQRRVRACPARRPRRAGAHELGKDRAGGSTRHRPPATTMTASTLRLSLAGALASLALVPALAQAGDDPKPPPGDAVRERQPDRPVRP